MNNEFRNRRKKLFSKLRNNSSCIVFSEKEKYRNNDVTYKFRQSSNFFYLTGINDPSLVLIMTKYNNKASTILICHKPNDKDRLWTGQLPSSSSYKSAFGLDSVIYFDQLESIIFSNSENLYYEFHAHDSIQKFLSKIEKVSSSRYSTNSNYLSSRFDISKIVYEMRLTKTNH